MTVQAIQAPKARILVLHAPDAPELEVLKKLPTDAQIIGIGRTLEDLSGEDLACLIHASQNASNIGC